MTIASRLGNTPMICRKCYVNPVIIEAYIGGSLLQTLQAIADQDQTYPLQGLSPQEWIALRFLQQTSVPEVNGGRAT
jgi:DNA topoisomerase-1